MGMLKPSHTNFSHSVLDFSIITNLSFSSWEQNSTLHHYTLYQPSDLSECVKDLHRLCSNNHNSSLPAIREKYSQHKVNKKKWKKLVTQTEYVNMFYYSLMTFFAFVSVQVCGKEVRSSVCTSGVFPELKKAKPELDAKLVLQYSVGQDFLWFWWWLACPDSMQWKWNSIFS